MEEITAQEFWKLQDRLSEIEQTTGKLQVLRFGDNDLLYRRGFKKWFRSLTTEGGVRIYFADPSLVLTFLRKG
jgi:hypothetical protein